jgi:type II secretory pathway pseudopilin PulG
MTKMSDQQHLTETERGAYEKAIGKLQQANVLEKLLLFMIFGLALTAAVFGYIANQNAIKAAEEATKQQQEVIEKIEERTERIDRHLDCVVVFFTSENRQDLTIKDIDKCVIQEGDDPAAIFTPPQTQANQSQEPVTINPNGQGLEPMKPDKKPPANDGNGGGTDQQPEPSYTECIDKREGLLGKVTGVIACIRL